MQYTNSTVGNTYTREQIEDAKEQYKASKVERMSAKQIKAKTAFEKDEEEGGLTWTIIEYVVAALSALTASFFICFLFKLEGTPGYILAGVILLGWEALKNRFTAKSMRSFVGGKTINPIFATIAVVCIAGSVYSSFEGGKLGNATVNDPRPAIEASYAQEIATLEKKIATQYNTTWKGRVTAVAQKQIAVLEPQLIELKKRKRAEVNDAMVAMDSEGTIIGYLTILLEILLLVAHYMKANKLYDEHVEIMLKRGSFQPAPFNPVTVAPAPAVATAQVGFQMSKPNIKDPAGERDITIKARIRDYRQRLDKHVTKAEQQLQSGGVTAGTEKAVLNNGAILDMYEAEAAKRGLNV